MAQIDILKDVLDYSLRKFRHFVVGSSIYFDFNKERYAVAKLRKVENRNEYDGVTILYVSKLFGEIDRCDIPFRDVFLDSKRTSINVDKETDTYEWQGKPSSRDLIILAEHIERFIDLIGDFGNVPSDYAGAMGMAAQAAYQGLSGQLAFMSNNQQSIDMEEPTLLGGSEISETSEDSAEMLLTENTDNVLQESLISEYGPADSDLNQEELLVREEETEIPDVNYDMLADDVPEDEGKESELPEEDSVIMMDETSDEFGSEIVTKDKTNVSFEGKNETLHASPSSKKGFLGLFKGKKEKESESSRTHEISFKHVVSHGDGLSEQPEETYVKPFVTWDIGAKRKDDVVAALYNLDKGIYSLVISGSGTMKNFKAVPWAKYSDRITKVEIEHGVTSIGNNAFKSFNLLKSVTIPDSVLEIGLSAFEFCLNLETVQLSQNLKIVSDFAFAGAENLKEVVLPDSVEEIRDYAFDFSDGFIITCKEPRALRLGEGISYSDFTVKDKVHTSKLSANNYMS